MISRAVSCQRPPIFCFIEPLASNTAGRPKYFADVKIRRQDAETVVKLTIEGHPGSWVKMADQPNDAATDGIRPVRDEKIR